MIANPHHSFPILVASQMRKRAGHIKILRNGVLVYVHLLVVSATLFATPGSGQSSNSAQQRMEDLQNHLTRYVVIKNGANDQMDLLAQMKVLNVPAVSVAAIRNGTIDWVQGYGVDSLGGAKVTPDTLFGAASISKPITALGVLKLIEEGKIDLDTNVNQYLKRWKIPDNQFTVKEKVTVRELLNHTSGIGTHNGEIYDPSAPVPTLLQLLDGEKPARTAAVRVEAVPGRKFAYSNGGYLVLALLIEDVTGESFAEYMKRSVLDPIGMKNSSFDAPLPQERQLQAATAYGADGKWAVPPSRFVEPNLAAGGLWSTPTDLAKFLLEVRREFEGKSHKVLHKDTVRMMLTPGLGPSVARHYGLGFEVGGSTENPYIRHEGSAYFQDDMVQYLSGNGIVVMTSGGGGGALADEVIRGAGTVYNFPDFKSVERSVQAVPASELSRFVGTYVYIRVAQDGDRLTAEIPTGSVPVRLYSESPTRFFVLDGPQELSFIFDLKQNVTGVDFITPMGRHTLDRNSAH